MDQGITRLPLPKHLDMTESYLLDIETKRPLSKVGLGYLSLDRQIITLSGGELKRLRLAAALDSELTGIIYILDEPTAGSCTPKIRPDWWQFLRNLGIWEILCSS